MNFTETWLNRDIQDEKMKNSQHIEVTEHVRIKAKEEVQQFT